MKKVCLGLLRLWLGIRGGGIAIVISCCLCFGERVSIHFIHSTAFHGERVSIHSIHSTAFPFTIITGILGWDWHILKGTSSNYFYQELIINTGKECYT